MATQLDTIPASRDVTTQSVNTWAIDFANVLQTGQSIVSAIATLVTDMPGDQGASVLGFVLSATVAGTDVLVAWTGSVLTRNSVYQLETVATLNTGSKVALLTRVRCVA